MSCYPIRRLATTVSAIVLPLLLAGCGQSAPETTYWTWQINNREGQAVLETERFDLVFDGTQIGEPQAGQFQVAGPGTSSGAIPIGEGRTFQYQYADAALTMTLGERAIRITDAGSILAIDGNTYSLQGEPTLHLRPDGTIDYRAN